MFHSNRVVAMVVAGCSYISARRSAVDANTEAYTDFIDVVFDYYLIMIMSE
jgi:hypothetical protein